MRLSRFYQPVALTIGKRVHLDKTVSSHIHRVLRLKTEDEIQLFNGDGVNYLARILSSGKTVTVVILDSIPANNESPLQIHLGQAISRGERMDYTLQKSVELGVYKITPIMSQRVQYRLDDKRIQRKMKHWQKVIESSCAQSGRCLIPKLNQPMPIKHWLEIEASQGLLFTPDADKRLSGIEISSNMRVLIGPEGGLSNDEIKMVLENHYFSDISLGPRILRTETAALTAISILQSKIGDI